MLDAQKTVREIALEQPHSIRVFEHFGIDYCCGGRQPLSEACIARELSVDEVQSALDSAATTADPSPVYWSQTPLQELIEHIVAKHHSYVKAELPRLRRWHGRSSIVMGTHRPICPLCKMQLRNSTKS